MRLPLKRLTKLNITCLLMHCTKDYENARKGGKLIRAVSKIMTKVHRYAVISADK